MAGEGRPTTCDKRATSAMAEGLRAGLSVRAACGRAGISKTAHYGWLERGEAGEQPYRDYADACERAAADFVNDKLTEIDSAARKGNWQAAAWRLERGFPEDFSRRERQEVELTGKGGQPIQIGADALVEKLGLDKLLRIARNGNGLTPDESEPEDGDA